MWGLILSLIAKVGPMIMGPVSQFVTGINIGQVLNTLVGFGAAAIASVKKYWKIYLIAILIALQALTAYGWQHDHQALVAEKASHQADNNSYKAAQAAAVKAAQEEKARLANDNKEKAHVADQNYSGLLSKYRANLMRYQVAQSSTGSNSGGQSNSGPQGADGPGAGTDLSTGSVTITDSDAQICAANTARLQAAHDWALTLNKDVN